MKKTAAIKVQTLGNFQIWREEEKVKSKDWGRDTTAQLFQFMVTARHRRGLHKEQIIDRLWEDADIKAKQQNFKVALHGLNKVLEPNRKSRTEALFILRQGATYQLNTEHIWIDVEAIEQYISIGNQALAEKPKVAQKAYTAAIDLHHGVYLPNRIYEDWTSEERERIQVLALGAMVTLGELLLNENPLESIRLAQQALLIDNAWEDAYRLQMEAYFKKGNRPMAIKSYQQCVTILDKEFGVAPLPETEKLMKIIVNL